MIITHKTPFTQDEQRAYELAVRGATDAHIADELELPGGLQLNRFSRAIRRGRAERKIRIRQCLTRLAFLGSNARVLLALCKREGLYPQRP